MKQPSAKTRFDLYYEVVERSKLNGWSNPLDHSFFIEKFVPVSALADQKAKIKEILKSYSIQL